MTLKDLRKEAEAKTASFEQNQQFVDEEMKRFGSGKAVEGSLKAYYKEFRKVLLTLLYDYLISPPEIYLK